MRSQFVLPLLILLGACGTPSVQPAETETTGDAIVQSPAADGLPPEGRYRAVDETGFALIEELRPDGTYSFMDEQGEVLEEGTYLQKTPELPCFTPNTQGAVEKCWQDEIGEDGVWRTTDPDTGSVAVIERIDQE